MTLKIDRQHACKLSTDCLTVAQMLEREAADPETTADRREIAQRIDVACTPRRSAGADRRMGCQASAEGMKGGCYD